MREIKFRAWDKKQKEWYGTSNPDGLIWNGFALFGECTMMDMPQITYLNNLEITQFTGLKDKNGKEIYEGDIVGKNTKSGYNKQTIVWDNDHACFDWQTTTGDDWPDGFSGFIDEYEVIGNIYENKDLLK